MDTVTQYSATSSGTPRDQVKYGYTNYGELASFTQDPDSTIGGASGRDDYAISYTYETASPSGGAVKRCRIGASYPGGSDLTYEYSSAANCLDDAASRVTDVKVGAVVVASYLGYTGPSMLVHTRLDEPAAHFDLTSGSPAYSDRLDRFNRTILSKWFVKGNGPSHDVSLAYDEDSNITTATDNLHKNSGGDRNWDMAYTLDSLNRLLNANQGQLSGSSIQSGKHTGYESWTLDQVGNWANSKLDLTGGNSPNYSDAGEYQEDRTLANGANEIDQRKQDTNNTAGYEHTYSLVYDADGNLTDDGIYAYRSDAFGRMCFVYVTGTTDVVEALRYNGLGYLIGRHYDADASGGDPDSSDPWFFHCYDERWRMLGTVRLANGGSASEAFKERFVYHAAGAGGYGGSSYIDAVILRDADKNTTHGAVNGWWQDAADGALENRVYDCQSWRADVSALLTDTGKLVEGVKYSSYGVPLGLPAGDIYASGQWTSAESGVITAAIGGAYDLRYDIDLDGDVDANDVAAANAVTGGYQTLGRGVLTSTSVANRKGYAGRETDSVLLGNKQCTQDTLYDVELGRDTDRHAQSVPQELLAIRDAFVLTVLANTRNAWGVQDLSATSPHSTCIKWRGCTLFRRVCHSGFTKMKMTGTNCPAWTQDMMQDALRAEWCKQRLSYANEVDPPEQYNQPCKKPCRCDVWEDRWTELMNWHLPENQRGISVVLELPGGCRLEGKGSGATTLEANTGDCILQIAAGTE